MEKLKAVFIELLPFFIATIITTPLSKLQNLTGELLITLVYALIVFSLFLIRYKKEELKIFLIGVIAGLIVEGWGRIVFLFSWQKFNSFLPIPIWLLIAWGFGFIAMRRIGNIMLKDEH